MSEQDQVPLAPELLAMMRNAAAIALRLREPFITARSILLALLDEPHAGPELRHVIAREKLEALPVPDDLRKGVTRMPESGLDDGELPSIVRFDTLGFKTPDGRTTVWLSRESFGIFGEGARRAEGTYLPKHLAFGLAAESVKSNGILAQLRVEPGAVTDAIYRL